MLKDQYTLFVPLIFWFNRNNGLALPLIALQYHEVRLNFEFRPFDECCVYTGPFNVRTNKPVFAEATLLIDYIYLDSEERRRFAQVGHEYLIEQLQFTGEESIQTNSAKLQLHFNHPTKELVWGMKLGNYCSGKQFMAYTNTNDWFVSARNQMAEKLILGQILTHSSDGTLVNQDSDTLPGAPWTKITNVSEIQSWVYGLPTASSMFIYVVGSSYDYVKYTFAGSPVELRSLVSGHANAVLYSSTPYPKYRLTATVTSNNLTIEHLSQPVSKYTVDNRDQWIKDQDITVWQQANYGLHIDGTTNPVYQGLIQLNGHDRFDKREGAYFNYVQPYQHHTRTPADGINVYSFALKPEEHQPSGTCNMSRIDTTQLNLWFQDVGNTAGADFRTDYLDEHTLLYVFAFSYNVLRIMSGMGGLAYSN
jgi:hypothetical protein